MNGKLKALLMLSLCTFLLAVGWPATARADLTVDDDGVQCPRADYTNLQDAVDAAQPGEVVRVCPGLYMGTITIAADKAGLTLRGVRHRTIEMMDRVGDPSQEAVLVGSPEGMPGFAVQADDVAIVGFTIQDTGDTGIEVKPADGVTPVHGARIARNRLDTVGDPSVQGTDCAGGRGINFEVANAATAIGNYITNSCGAGIRLKTATNGLLKRNVIDGSRKRPGIAVRSGDSHQIIANTSLNNREAGISLHGSIDNLVRRNMMMGNGVPGDPLRPIPGKGSNTDADDTTNLPLENDPDNTWEGNRCITENRDGLCTFRRVR
ncbi:MAG: hypothetical protein ETSY2_17005 [Candidatus Entotheonella gemina]|uniref:Periplasmic copper-binding protein NosD beta helix domain-containing protein n=1 Tax=Candidatus Entotheonella gemina TaxID=1429439 RepID=W4M8F5_9BACT|nr:MAG: hypothetical protein ETSY2_17005 [Candidatus Entotheonella gemina]